MFTAAVNLKVLVGIATAAAAIALGSQTAKADGHHFGRGRFGVSFSFGMPGTLVMPAGPVVAGPYVGVDGPLVGTYVQTVPAYSVPVYVPVYRPVVIRTIPVYRQPVYQPGPVIMGGGCR